MMWDVNYTIEDTKKSIKGLRRNLALLQSLLPLPDFIAFTGVYDEHIIIEIPFNPALFLELRRGLGKGWKRLSSRSYSDGDKWLLVYEKDEDRVHIVLDSSERGATCKRVVVGEVTLPRYEIVCN